MASEPVYSNVDISGDNGFTPTRTRGGFFGVVSILLC